MFDAFALNALNPYATNDELEYMAQAGRYIEPKNAVMLGAGPGVFALALMDWYIREKRQLPDLTVVDISTCQYVHAHLAMMGVPEDRVTCLIDDSAKAGLQWAGNKLGMLIIDADHSTDAVLRDIDAWFPHVVNGGLIFFHDYLERVGGFNGKEAWQKGEVAEALKQRAHLNWQVETEVGISIAYRKL